MANDIIFSNNFVKCYSDHLVIDLYYFPYGDKKVKYNEIHSCQLIPMREMGFLKIKMWGMALSPIWWHSDLHRLSRENCIILDTNHWPKIGLTMDDNDIIIVYKLIKDKMDPNKVSIDDEKETNYLFESKPEKNFENIKTK
jgi:hypothetical protein